MMISEIIARIRDGQTPPQEYLYGSIRGDRSIDPGVAARTPVAKKAAVLVPILLDGLEPDVLLTVRSQNLENHRGQVAFPGGRMDPSDVDAVATALREAEEEVALPRTAVEIMGQMGVYETVTGFAVTPILGRVAYPFSPKLNPKEVDVAFRVPLGHLIAPKNHIRETRQFGGVERHFFAIPHDDHYIWGATAAMLVNLSRGLHQWVREETV